MINTQAVLQGKREALEGIQNSTRSQLDEVNRQLDTISGQLFKDVLEDFEPTTLWVEPNYPVSEELLAAVNGE